MEKTGGNMRRAVRSGFFLLLAGVFPHAYAQNAPAQPTDKTIAVFGQTIHYWDVGSGPIVVLVHGLGSRKEEWLPVVEPLSKNYRLLIPDQIGFGHSDKPLLDYSIQTYVDFLNEFLHDLKVEKASFVGESLGGWICGLYAVELSAGAHLVPMEKLILVDAAGLKQDKPIPDLNPSSLAAMRGVMQAVFFDTSWLDDNTLRKIFADKLSLHDGYTVRSLLSNPAIDAERLDDKLANIKVPTLVIWGKQDSLLPISSGERYAGGIAGARLVSFDKCGHIPAVEQSESFVSTVTGFLGGAAAAH
jgi:pimeloyl-ACP methyl ester carboxylesterase